MSIRPEGGWQEPDSNQRAQNIPPAQSGYGSRRSYLTCKICDSGTLSPKTVFRMSGPAVAIGFILLIPSIVGMILSGLMFIGVNVPIGNESSSTASEPNEQVQSDFDAGFRRSCAAKIRQNYRTAGINEPRTLIEQYCECALSTFKETNSETMAAETCNQRAKDGTLDSPSRDVDAFYSSNVPRERRTSPGSNLLITFFRVLGSVSAIALGISSFVGGLLGWLLVMRKRVLQCDLCGAVVNAS